MKKIILFAICIVFAVTAYSQTNDDLKYMQNMFGMNKKNFIDERIKVSKSDSARFWYLYEEYELFRSEISEKRAGNLQNYIDNHVSLTDVKTDEIVKVSIQINAEYENLLQKTYKKMAKEISASTAAKFYYLEMYVEAMGRLKITEVIPPLGKIESVK